MASFQVADQEYYLKLSSKLIRDFNAPFKPSKDSTKQPKKVSMVVWLCAKQLLIFLLDKPKGWRIYPECVAKEMGISINTVWTWLNVLIWAGYVNRQKFRDEKGQALETIYLIHDSRVARPSPEMRVNRADWHEMRRLEEEQKKLHKEQKDLKQKMGSEESYEQEFSQEKQAQDDVSTTLEDSKLSDPTLCNLNTMYKRSKVSTTASSKEDSPRSQVHNSYGDCKLENSDGITQLAQKARETFKAFEGSGFAGASKNAKALVKEKGIDEQTAINELQQAFFGHWDEIDVLSQGISWIQLFASLEECRKYWRRSNKEVKSKFSYYLTALANYVKHLKDQSLAPIHASLLFMSERYA